MARVMITTVDNPFNPFTQFREWWTWDTTKGYHTAAYLARVSSNSSDLPDALQDRLDEQMIDEIIREHNGEIYKKVYEEEIPLSA